MPDATTAGRLRSKGPGVCDVCGDEIQNTYCGSCAHDAMREDQESDLGSEDE